MAPTKKKTSNKRGGAQRKSNIRTHEKNESKRVASVGKGPKKAVVKKKRKVLKKVAAKPRRRASKRIASKKAPAPKQEGFKLQRFEENPILTPQGHVAWESQYVFNPAAVHDGGKVHLVYRAIGNDGVSVFGYAVSNNGLQVDARSSEPMFATRSSSGCDDKEWGSPYAFSSGGSWTGCEDPRLTLLEGRVYMMYTAFDGWGSVRIALASIDKDDFASQRWSAWSKPVLLSPPGEMHKNWVLFPEKIHGHYAILHGITPKVLVEYVDSLDFDGSSFIQSKRPPNDQVQLRKGVWDNRVRGVGPPPIKTKEGWLVFYHAIDERESSRYKLGAMLLDLDDPTKVLYRAFAPVLEPDEWYENSGWKAGIVYSCGAIVKDGQLFVYYGGADTVVCVATADLAEFLKALKAGGNPKIKGANAQRSKI